MATIGSALTAPEAGWQRFDNTDTNISYEGTWVTTTDSNCYNGSQRHTLTVGDKIKFNFTGTSIRLISTVYTSRSNNITIIIDGVSESFSEYKTTSVWQSLVYEKIGLENKEHSVQIIANTTNWTELDAIDIGSTGILKPYKVYSTKYLICDKNSISFSTDGTVLNKLQGALSDSLFINNGINDYTVLNNTVSKLGIEGLYKGTLGSGKQFEISLDDNLTSINSIE